MRDAARDRPWRMGGATRPALALVVVICAVQIGWVTRSFLQLAVGKVWENRSRDAVSRSADAAYGYDYMQYIRFLREEVPEEAVVVLTRTDGRPQYDSKPFLQYFLIPRTVVDCPSGPLETCLLELSAPHVYFAYGGGVSLPERASPVLRAIPFDESLGIFAPR